jgi:hypothetical protein
VSTLPDPVDGKMSAVHDEVVCEVYPRGKEM